MSVPFSSDEFVLKRSLFSSIFGVANQLKQAKTAVAAPATSSTTTTGTAGQQQFADESIQPCTSSKIFAQTPKDGKQTKIDSLTVCNGSSPSQTSACSPTSQLGKQFSAQLQFLEEVQDDNEQRQKHNNNSDKTTKTLSREQIYAEIVRECNELEKQHHNDKEKRDQQEEKQRQMMMELNSELDAKSLSSNDKLITGDGVGFSLDLERLIKVVVAHVLKEMKGNCHISMEGVASRRPKRSESSKQDECDGVITQGENAEQILERKREQNNAAAARYRQRLKEQKDLLLNELCQLEEKNEQLKAEIDIAQREIDQLKAELWRSWHSD